MFLAILKEAILSSSTNLEAPVSIGRHIVIRQDNVAVLNSESLSRSKVDSYRYKDSIAVLIFAEKRKGYFWYKNTILGPF